jgi:hypothetical protein
MTITLRNVIVMNKHSNILKIPPFTDYYKDFVNRISNKMKAIEPSSDVPLFNPPRDDVEMDVDQVFGVIALNEHSDFQVKRIHELRKEDTRFILEVNILEFFPERLYDFVSVLCQKCLRRYIKPNH